MPAPRAPGAVFLSKNQTRQMENRNNAQQEALYKRPAPAAPWTTIGQPTMLTPGFVTYGPAFTGFYFTKIKGIISPAVVDSVQLAGTMSPSSRKIISHIAVCEYSADLGAYTFLEIARIRTQGDVFSLPFVFDRTIVFDPSKRYAIGVAFDIQDLTVFVDLAQEYDTGQALHWNPAGIGAFPANVGPADFTWRPSGGDAALSAVFSVWCRFSLSAENTAFPFSSNWY